MWNRAYVVQTPGIESVRKNARVLVIDDHVFPYQKIFDRDGYHFERWPDIKNLSQLTDGHYNLILLDIQGVGLNESPTRQGLGILEHIKSTNPAQAVIVYSAERQYLASNQYLALADAVLDKRAEYVEYKQKVDQLLISGASPGYFIAAMNRQLAESAILAPAAVRQAIKAFRRGNVQGLSRYLGRTLSDQKQIDTILQIIGVGIATIGLFTA